jgi:hypothetical protein
VVIEASKRIAAPRGASASRAAGLEGVDSDDLDAIDAWLAARLGELRHAEARLAQREAKMTAVSTGLAKLLEGFKHQVIQAEHVRSAIAETHHNAVKWFEQIAQTNNGRLDSIEASWAERIAKLEQVDTQVDEWVHEIEERAVSLVKPVQERIERTVADMHALVQEAVAGSEVTVQQGIDAAMAQAIERACAAILDHTREAEQAAKMRGAQRLERLESEFDQAVADRLAELKPAVDAATAEVDAQLAALRARCDQTMQHVAQQSDAAAAMLAKVNASKLDLSPELVDDLDTVTAAGRSLLCRLEEQTRHSSEVAARMESLTKLVARLGEVDPHADTVDLDAGTPLWLENAERMLRDLERSLGASRRTLASLEEARLSLASQANRPAHAKPRDTAAHVPAADNEDQPMVERDSGKSLAEAMMIVSQQVAGTAVKPEVLEAAVRSIESLNQLARDVAASSQRTDVPAMKPRRGDKTAIDRYAEDLRRRIEEARKAR